MDTNVIFVFVLEVHGHLEGIVSIVDVDCKHNQAGEDMGAIRDRLDWRVLRDSRVLNIWEVWQGVLGGRESACCQLRC